MAHPIQEQVEKLGRIAAEFDGIVAEVTVIPSLESETLSRGFAAMSESVNTIASIVSMLNSRIEAIEAGIG